MMSALGNLACPRPERLSEAVSMGADEALREHVARCDACQAEWQAQVELLGLIRRIEVPPPEDERVEALRTGLLSRPRARAYRPAWYRASSARTALAMAAGVLVLIGAAVAVAWIWRRPAPRPVAPVHDQDQDVRQGQHARPGERLARGQMPAPESDEPAPAVPAVNGTTGAGPLLRPDERQPHGPAPHPARRHPRRTAPPAAEAPPAPEPAPTTPGPAAAPAAAPAPPPAAPAAPPRREASPEERLLSAGLQELKAGDFRGAAGTFGRMVQVAGDGPFAEDAGFWLGVAQARAGQRSEAIASLRRFLSRHGRSPRRWEAASILGYQLLAAGELDEAEGRFTEAALAPSGEIRQSAHAGLAAVRARRAP